MFFEMEKPGHLYVFVSQNETLNIVYIEKFWHKQLVNKEFRVLFCGA